MRADTFSSQTIHCFLLDLTLFAFKELYFSGSLRGEGQSKALLGSPDAQDSICWVFCLNHYRLLGCEAAEDWISVLYPLHSESTCRQAPCPLLPSTILRGYDFKSNSE